MRVMPRTRGGTVAKYDGRAQEALDSVELVTVILGTLYACTDAEETVMYLRETVGPDVASKIRARLGNGMFVALYADTAAA